MTHWLSLPKPSRVLTIWAVWISIASIGTLVFGIFLVARTIAQGDLAVDAVLAQRLSGGSAAMLAAVWIPPSIYAVFAHRALRRPL